MTDEQYVLIHRKRLPNNADSWFSMFETLFPEASRPASPYISTADPAAVQQFVGFFRWCGADEFNKLRGEWRQRRDVSGYLQSSAEAIVDEAFEIALALRSIRPEGPSTLLELSGISEGPQEHFSTESAYPVPGLDFLQSLSLEDITEAFDAPSNWGILQPQANA